MTICVSFPPPKWRSDTVCTSLIGDWLDETYALISCWLRSREVAVAVRLLVVGQADARIGHDRLAAAGLDRGRPVAVAAGAVELVAVERVVAAELVAHLVRDVVDRVEVSDRGRDARAAACLVRAADDAEIGDAAAGLAEREMADVVVARADDLADHVAGSRRARAPGDLSLGEAGCRAARAVRRRRLAPRVEVEQVVVRDQLEPDAHVVLVDLVDPVHERDLGRRHVRRAAEVVRVARVGDQSEPVRAELLADLGVLRCVEARARHRRALDEHAVCVLRVARVVARIGRRRAADVERVDVPRAVRRPNRGVEAERRQVGVDRRRPVGEPEPAVGLDPGMPRREARRHHRRLVEREQLEPAVRGRERDDERARLGAQGVLAGRERERRPHAPPCPA